MHTLTLLVAGHNPPPLVDIDNTVFIQLGIFIVLFIILGQLVFRPYLALRRAQQEHTDGARDLAEQLAANTSQKIQVYEQQLMAARKHAAELRGQIRRSTEENAGQQRAVARQRAEEILAAGRKALEKNTQVAQLELRVRADSIAKAMASKVLGREV